EQRAREERGDEEPAQAELGRDRREYDDERGRRPRDLEARSAEDRHDRAGDDRGVEPVLRRHARGDGERHRQRQRDDGHDRAGAAAAAFAAGAFAQDVAPAALRWIGAAPSHFSYERYDMSLGVTAGQAPRRAERIEEDREVLNVPGHYGALVSVTGEGAASVF